MKNIPLTQGKVAIVDDEDYEHLRKFKWMALGNARKYAARTVRDPIQRAVFIHRIVMGNPDGMQVDHINGDTMDNRKENLRICTRQQNACNRKLNKNSASGVKGVTWHKRDLVWVAHIRVKTKGIHLGNFRNLDDARSAYEAAAKAMHGEFARLQ
jgi:hypothetical protein